MEIYIATDLLRCGSAYRYNTVYAFRSMTSVRRLEACLRAGEGDHRVALSTAAVGADARTVQVITETAGGEYRGTAVFEDYDAARDHAADIRAAGATAEHDIVRIHARFTPTVLRPGWAE